MHHSKKERDNYFRVSKEFYEYGIFSNETLDDIKEEYILNNAKKRYGLGVKYNLIAYLKVFYRVQIG